MKSFLKLLSIVLFSICLTSFTSCGQKRGAISKLQTTETKVYLCNSFGAKVYHSSPNCRGLSRCTHGIIEVSLSDAVNKYGRRPCKICERNTH